LELLQSEKLHKSVNEPVSKKEEKEESEKKPEGHLSTHSQKNSNLENTKSSANEENSKNGVFCTSESIQQSTKAHQDSQSKSQQTSLLKPLAYVNSSFSPSSTCQVQIDKDKEKDDTFKKEEKIQEEKTTSLQESCCKPTSSVMKDALIHSNNVSVSQSSSNFHDALFEANSHENLSFIDPCCYPSKQILSYSDNMESTQLTEPLYKMLLNSLTSTSRCEEEMKSTIPFLSNPQDLKTKKCISPSYVNNQESFYQHHPNTHLKDFRFNEYPSDLNVHSEPSDYEHYSFFFSPINKRQDEQEQRPKLQERENENIFFNDPNRFVRVFNKSEQNQSTVQKTFVPSSTVSPLPSNHFFMPVKPSDDTFYPNGYNSYDWNPLKKTSESFPKGNKLFFYFFLAFYILNRIILLPFTSIPTFVFFLYAVGALQK
jgi:hypothetical protein